MESNPKFVIDFVELGAPVRRYDGSTPALVFAACLIELKLAYETGRLKSIDPEKIKQILNTVNEYDAGKAAWFLLKKSAPFTINMH